MNLKLIGCDNCGEIFRPDGKNTLKVNGKKVDLCGLTCAQEWLVKLYQKFPHLEIITGGSHAGGLELVKTS